MKAAKKKLERWKREPIAFVTEELKAEPDPWQLDVLRAFPTHQRLAMKACKGPGKTSVLAWCAWNFLATRPKPKIAATSISAANLGDNLWPEMSKWRSNSQFLNDQFEWTKTRIYCRDYPEEWFMSARTWPQSADKTKQADTLAGLHADYLMFILDESGGIPDAVAATAEAGLATGIETKLIQAGNPTHLEGPLYRAVTSEAHLWYVVSITGDPDDPKRSTRVSIQWARDQIATYGKDNPWVLVNVFGKFPPSSLNALLGPNDLEASIGRHVSEDKYEFIQKRIGIDVARFGDDRTVLFPRQGLAAFNPAIMRNARTNEIAARVAKAKQKWSCEMEFIDDTGGWGAGVIDSLLLAGIAATPINASGKADDPRYINKRAECWFRMADWVKRGGSLPKNDELRGELTTPTYMFSSNGKFQIESKDQIKERLGRSPDLADALSLTFAIVDLPSQNTPMQRWATPHKLRHDYDPLDPNRQ